ncbi:hypothetical protein SAMN05216596_1123 [Pseudomonas congelans]|uniref:Uncharacterized protein n=1 Tax=Pseudomonas congelans TaxID=200452 RepID=A0A1H0W656_9PSED|nr:hypothetical protein SAMN05216596_1123 [Pseudomonas congelans]
MNLTSTQPVLITEPENQNTYNNQKIKLFKRAHYHVQKH